jgi:ketosteroid isomerase-like protein
MEFANVLRHVDLPFSVLALDSRLRFSNRPRRRSRGSFQPRRELQFSRNPHVHATGQFGWDGLPWPQPCYPKREYPKFRNFKRFDSWHPQKEHPRHKGATAMLRPLILLLALTSLPFAWDISRAQGDETKIIALENLWNQMQINHEADAMGKMLDSDFVLTDYDGTVMTKGQFLASIRHTSTQLTIEVSEDMKLHRHGDTVIVTGSTHEKGTEKGKPFVHRGRFTDTWIKKDGQWLCVASQLSLLNR